MKKNMIVMMLLFCGCSTETNISTFRNLLIGRYSIHLAAREFFVREQKDLIPNTFDDDQIEFDGNSDLQFLINNIPTHVWSFVEKKRGDKAIFRLVNQDKYVGVILDGSLLVVQTNVVSSPDKVTFEWVVPFATKQDQ
ncbi:MAG: hypothetical protein ACRCVW_01500 [Brevinema sp.]